jgi:FtsP/CotA-like multicopper oxidase with cupredoxin domain
MRVLVFACFSALSLTGAKGPPSAPPSLEEITINDNRSSAGILRDGILTVQLDVRAGNWHPDADADPGLQVLAFAEEGRALQIPAPLIRVAEGTEILASVRNPLTNRTLTVHGLYSRGVNDVKDTIQVAPGTVRQVRFTAGTPGTYYYWASTGATLPTLGREGIDSQLSGALIIDPRGAPALRDRILVIGFWSESPLGILGGDERQKVRFVINGKSWPHTERLTHNLGDTIRWRIVSPNNQPHPMHLHGFYFRVLSRGGEGTDTVYDQRAAPRLAVTERIAPGRTASISWVAERAGNWLFHCHDNAHIMKHLPIAETEPPKASDALHMQNHTQGGMAGLVMGVHVVSGEAPNTVSESLPRRHMRLIAQEVSGGSAAVPAYGFVLEDPVKRAISAPALLPGPAIVLRRGEPVSITVVNQLPEPTAVHWHGIELESYFDGVAGFAGLPGRIAPAIAPRDSFEARFTPPRAGTFIYHTHIDEIRQQRAGLSGALLVVDDPDSYNAETDRVLLLSTPRGADEQGVVLLNGSGSPAAWELRAGTRYRFRVINIHTYRPSMTLAIRRNTEVLTWRALAKDGADLPADGAIDRAAQVLLGNGETHDFEFLPTEPGELRLEVHASSGVLLVAMPIRVR